MLGLVDTRTWSNRSVLDCPLGAEERHAAVIAAVEEALDGNGSGRVLNAHGVRDIVVGGQVLAEQDVVAISRRESRIVDDKLELVENGLG